ncbi:hypothetical protein [Mycetocola zhujimingii]|uniref:hypothetical protein n=1 Tax=Mycetocola zhujimingii TaxID=2079792 RepID=UPI000D392045|nr:hypothetical protein [Mycetocola zhujimingii]AWB87650.1 hypothetical protein C3E77_14255 [Mycetocola zhujimingii]
MQLVHMATEPMLDLRAPEGKLRRLRRHPVPRPLTLAYGLSDSPIGPVAWLIDHFERYSTTRNPPHDLLTNVMLYWLRNSIRSSIRYYNESMGGWSAAKQLWGDETSDDQATDAAPSEAEWSAEAGGWSMKIEVLTAIAVFPDDITDPPKGHAERFFDARRFRKMPAGGRFAALEVPDLVAADIREFVSELTVTGHPSSPR